MELWFLILKQGMQGDETEKKGRRLMMKGHDYWEDTIVTMKTAFVMHRDVCVYLDVHKSAYMCIWVWG